MDMISTSSILAKLKSSSLSNSRVITDIVITRPDKGNVVAMLNRSDYNNKVLAILEDSSKFSTLAPQLTNTIGSERPFASWIVRKSVKW